MLPLLFGLVATPAIADTQKPNVIFIFADDQRAGTLNLNGAGNPDIITPNIDKLAQRGFLFDNSYVFGAAQGSVCYPSRTQILSGQSIYRQNLDRPSIDRQDMHLPTAFKLAGYQTMRTGKANNVPYGINQEFDVNIERANRGSAKGNKAYFQDAKDFIEQKTLTGLGEKAVRWDGESPFFMYLAVGTPHHPYPRDKTSEQQYQGKDITLPEDALIKHERLLQLYTDAKPKKPPFHSKLTTESEAKKELTQYYASITYMDTLLGDLETYLKQKDLYDNTIIVVASDNGLSIGSHGLKGKSNLMEFGGMHVYMVFAGPGIAQGRSQTLTYLLDMFPTLSDLTGIDKPASLQGTSLVPVINGEKSDVREFVYTSYGEKNMQQRALRNARWKIIFFPDIDAYELYDLQNDPRELNDLSNSKAHQQELVRMKAQLALEGKKWGEKPSFRQQGFRLKRQYKASDLPAPLDLSKF
ncbi:sulfatase-like hydrolase/transferase [Echinimonas agarilytica]